MEIQDKIKKYSLKMNLTKDPSKKSFYEKKISEYKYLLNGGSAEDVTKLINTFKEKLTENAKAMKKTVDEIKDKIDGLLKKCKDATSKIDTVMPVIPTGTADEEEANKLKAKITELEAEIVALKKQHKEEVEKKDEEAAADLKKKLEDKEEEFNKQLATIETGIKELVEKYEADYKSLDEVIKEILDLINKNTGPVAVEAATSE